MNTIMIHITIELAWKHGAPMWDVAGEDFPPLAPTYARLDTVLGLLQARARDWERFYVVTVVEPDVPVRVLAFDGTTTQKLLPLEMPKAA